MIMRKQIPVFLCLMLLLGLLLPAQNGMAAEEVILNEDINKTAGDLEIPRGTVVNGGVNLNVGKLSVLGIVNGNVSSNMGQVRVEGEVNGDVETNMGQVVILGNVSGNVLTRMGEVIVDGSVGGNLSADLGTARIDGAVGGSVGSGLGEISITGTVAGDVNSEGGSVYINGLVEGDVTVEQGLVELGPEAVVTGRVSVGRGAVNKSGSASVGSIEIEEEISAGEITGEDESAWGSSETGYRFDGVDENLFNRVTGEIMHSLDRVTENTRFLPRLFEVRRWPHLPYTQFSYSGSVAVGVIRMLIMFALAALIYALFPKPVKRVSDALLLKPGPVIGWGILAAVLALPLMILLVITIIGIPLVIVEIVVLAAAAVLGYTGIVNLVGDRIITAASGGKVNPLVSIAIGVLIFGLLGMIPILGGLLTMVLSVIALGMALVSRFGTYDQVIRESTEQGEQTSGPEMEDGPGMETSKEENARPEMKPDNEEKSRPEDGMDES